MGEPDFDAAATFAAEVVVNDMPYTDLFTATSGTCPTFANGTFTPKNCPGSQPTAGILTDPGSMAQYYADMAFRRVRFVQETFVCSPMPAELSGSPQPMGAGLYTSPWPFTSISGGPREHQLPGHVGRHLRQLPHDAQPHRAALCVL